MKATVEVATITAILVLIGMTYMLVGVRPAWPTELSPAQTDITAIAGGDYTFTRRLKAGSQVANLTGYTFRASVKSGYSASTALADFAVSVTPLTGMISLRLNATQTTSLKLKVGVWDLLMIAPDGTKSYLMRGTFKCLPNATN